MAFNQNACEHLVYLGLGSNLGNRAGNLRRGLELLEEAGLKLLGCSHIYQTAPWGGVEQPDFYNMAVAAKTELSPWELLYLAKAVEYAVGRRPTVVWGPRVLDIDILLYDELVYSEPTDEVYEGARADIAWGLAESAAGPVIEKIFGSEIPEQLTFDLQGLTIPHKELTRRAFVLAPLAELAPELEAPGLGYCVSRLLAELPAAERAGVVRLPDEDDLMCGF